MARAALEELALDRVWFVPAGRSPFKPDVEPAPSGSRLAMVRLALAGCPWTSVDDSGIHLDEPSFSVETVRRFRRRFPDAEITYLIGADNVAGLPKWRDAVELGASVEFAACPRPGVDQEPFPEPFRGRWLQAPAVEVSSSEIRGRIRYGRGVNWLVPPAVDEFLRNNRLYL